MSAKTTRPSQRRRIVGSSRRENGTGAVLLLNPKAINLIGNGNLLLCLLGSGPDGDRSKIYGSCVYKMIIMRFLIPFQRVSRCTAWDARLSPELCFVDDDVLTDTISMHIEMI